MQDFLSTLLEAVIVAAVPVITTFLIKFINTKINEAKTKTNNEYVNAILDSSDKLINSVVNELSQTIVDTAKKEQLFDKEKATEVFNQAKDKIMESLTNETKELITKTYNITIDKFITMKIEEAVRNNK